jgi:ribosomal protein S18 acetylase RimI-like enzyme
LMGTILEIRDARHDDGGGIQEVARTTWDHAYRKIIPQEVRTEFINRAYSQASLAHRMREGVFLVAVADRKLVGFADFHPVSADEVELAAIYVLPEAQRHGIGTRLLEAGIDRFPSATKVTLRVERENAPARRFYESCGFITGQHFTQRFFGHEMHEVEMVLTIEKPTR